MNRSPLESYLMLISLVLLFAIFAAGMILLPKPQAVTPAPTATATNQVQPVATNEANKSDDSGFGNISLAEGSAYVRFQCSDAEKLIFVRKTGELVDLEVSNCPNLATTGVPALIVFNNQQFVYDSFNGKLKFDGSWRSGKGFTVWQGVIRIEIELVDKQKPATLFFLFASKELEKSLGFTPQPLP